MAKSENSFAVVEDDEIVCNALGSLLGAGPEYVCVGLFTDAKNALHQLPLLNPDVVLVDLQLGTESGIDLIQQLKPKMHDTQFIVITVFAESERVLQSLKAGATGYILKDSEPDEYRRALNTLLSGGSPLSPGIARLLIESFHQPQPREIEYLTPREREVLLLLADGSAYKEVAYKLDISIDTVRSHIRHIYEKLQVQTRTQAINLLQGKRRL